MGIQINGNTNNINAGIGSLSIEDINELDIVGVATAANFKTGVSDLHSVGLTLSGGQIDVGSNIKIGTAGVVTATSFVGSGANLTGITQTTINNNANNRLITGSGTANTLEGEANLRFDGSQLEIETSAQNNLKINSSNSDGPNIHFERSGSAFAYLGSAAANTSGTATDLALRAQGNLVFATNGGNERLRITSAGRLGIGDDSPSVIVSIKDTAPKIKFIDSDATGTPETLLDGAGGDLILDVDKDNEKGSTLFAVKIDGSERLRIASDGATSFYSQNVAWTEGPVVLEASNGYGEIFFRSTGSTHGTSVTGTWGLGKLAGTDGFGLLKNSMTGGGAVRADAVFSSDNSGYMTFGKTTRSPKQIRFLVRAGRAGDGYTNNPYQFHTVIQNETSGFSGGWDATGKTKFTAPVTGFYYFSTHAAYGQTGVSFGTRLLRYNSSNSLQDTYELYRFIQGSAGSHYGGAGSIALPLDAGDYVLLQPQYVPYHLNSNLNFFCGFLIG